MSVSLSFSLLLSHIDSHSLTCSYDTTVHPNVLPTLEEFVRNAEKCDVGVQLYYTVGQISNHAPELFAFAGMNGEILLRDSADKPPSPGKNLITCSMIPNTQQNSNLTHTHTQDL